MNENLKTFATQAEYDTWVSGTYPEPNVSYIEATDEVKFTDYELAGQKEYVDEYIDSSEVQGTTLNPIRQYVTKVDVPEGVTAIGYQSMMGCGLLSSVTFPSTLTTLSADAFKNCTSLASVDLPSSMTTIAYGVFKGCTSLTSVTVRATTPPTLANTDAFSNTPANMTIYVPSASVDTYKAAENWSTYASQITAITE